MRQQTRYRSTKREGQALTRGQLSDALGLRICLFSGVLKPVFPSVTMTPFMGLPPVVWMLPTLAIAPCFYSALLQWNLPYTFIS